MDGTHPLPKRRRLAVRLALLAGLAVILGGGMAFVAIIPPTGSPFFPKCWLHQYTGLHCPGCGLTRCVHALLIGQPLQALAYNALFPLLLPVVCISIGRSLWQWAWDVPGRPRASTWLGRNSRWIGWVFGLVLLLFTILRNVPAYPFTLLAPHEITAG